MEESLLKKTALCICSKTFHLLLLAGATVVGGCNSLFNFSDENISCILGRADDLAESEFCCTLMPDPLFLRKTLEVCRNEG